MKIWHGRHAGPLIMVWVVALILWAILRYAEDVQPAMGDLFFPIYAIIIAAALFGTFKWFRARARDGASDRRRQDRRRSDRRDDLDSVP